MAEHQTPTTKEIYTFLGFIRYHQQYIANYSKLDSPLGDTFCKTELQVTRWDKRRESYLWKLEEALVWKFLLVSPGYNKTFIAQCDASKHGIRAVLSRADSQGREHPVLFKSWKLIVQEETYSTSQKKCACLVWVLQNPSCCLSRSRILIETGHCPLKWLQHMSPNNGCFLCWNVALQQHKFEINIKEMVLK